MPEMIVKLFDWPPLWTLAAVVSVWLLGWIGFPFGFGIYGPGLALACLIIGLWLMGSAAWLMYRARTTVNPRGQPTVLMTEGVFALSRNPIYLGDVFVVLAAVFWWDAPLGLLVAAGLVWVVTDRFISVEEDCLADSFGDAAALWFSKTRRWI